MNNKQKKFDLMCYLIICPENVKEQNIETIVQKSIEGGVCFIQLRSKTSSTNELIKISKNIANIISKTNKNVTFVINDNLSAVMQAIKYGIKIDGIHVGQNDTDVLICRQLLGKNAIIGLSVNTKELILKFQKPKYLQSIDYFGIAPMHLTDTKPDCYIDKNGKICELGIDKIKKLGNVCKIPFVVGGGIKKTDIPALASINASGFFVISAIVNSKNPKYATQKLIKLWKENK
jgi:thiamine-phosphate diphosphorylase